MVLEQAGGQILSWADTFIEGLLAESEKYQDVIKDLSTDAIASTIGKLNRASEEYQTGIDILQNRATASTSLVLTEAADEVDKDAFDAASSTNRARAEADEETDEEVFVAQRKTSAILIEVSDDISRNIADLRAFNDSWLGSVRAWLSEENDKLFDMFNLNTDIITEGNITILSIALGFLFDRFVGFFFEEGD